MTLLTASQAATFADLAYDTAASGDTASTTWRAKASLAALQKNGPTPADMSDFTTLSGFTGASGAFGLRDVTGFGAAFERKSSKRELIIAFRGTVSAFDWVSNFNIGMEPGPGGAIVHSGFNRVYNALQDELYALIAKANPEILHFVGHSLGGSMATLAMADFGLSANGRTCHLYTFGTPRIGGFALNSQLRSVLTPSSVRRVYSVSDPVPMIPLLPFQHFTAGATGLDFGFALITPKAHDRITYRNRMPADGWPPITPLAVKSDPAYWLGMAERAQGFSTMGYHALSMALAGIMSMLNIGGLALSGGITVLDRLAEALVNAAHIARNMAEMTLRFVKAALRLVNRAAIGAAVTTADLTQDFLRLVLDMLIAPIQRAARQALA
ncbi:lipase family protein [Sagittula sp. S175]|uniref:lipase family protein n=1 Tax=Sagittula sp. S175 TaxID=3415129 RepID=UPI003C7DB8AE